MMNMDEKLTMALSFLLIHSFVVPLIFAQEIGGPITEEQAEKIEKDPLLDIPISDVQATESAKKGIKSEVEPTESNLYFYTMPNETRPRLVWNVSFGDPVDKEVFVDAVEGDVLFVKSKQKPFMDSVFQTALQKPLYMASVSIAFGCILLVMVAIWRKKTKRLKKGSECS